MKINKLVRIGNWSIVNNAARTTIGLEGGKEPSSKWKKRILLAEHSPIRTLQFNWKWENIKYWVSMHLVRHKFGIEHFVTTQRSDRTNIDRDKKTQDSIISHEAVANVQAIINISRKRLCRLASKETREAWLQFLLELNKTEPEIFSVCVPECIYRGFCPEFKSCGYSETSIYKQKLQYYRKID